MPTLICQHPYSARQNPEHVYLTVSIARCLDLENAVILEGIMHSKQ